MPQLVEPVVPPGRLSAIPQPHLGVDELVLRPWLACDAPAVVAAYRDPQIQRWHLRSMSDEEAVSWVLSWPDRWAAETGAGWAIEVDGSVAGRMGCGLNLAEGRAEAAYWVVPRLRGRDVAPRALRAMTEWLFADLGFHRVELEHSTVNEASCRVAIKAGFPAEGLSRSSARHADGWHDMHRHGRVDDASTGRAGRHVLPDPVST